MVWRTPILHHQALGIHRGAYVQNTAPLTDDLQDGVLWVDTSTGPPYQLKCWMQAFSRWDQIGSVGTGGTTPIGALLWDADLATWTFAALDDVFALLSADVADDSHGPYLHFTQGDELRFQVDPVSGLYLAVTYHEDGTFDGSGANIQGGLQVVNSLARLSHQKSILQLVDLNTLEVVDQTIAQGAFYLIGPHNRPNTDYQLDSGGNLQWTGASHPPTGVLALDGGEDVNDRAVRLGVLNAADGPDNDVLWALCANTYGSLTTPALDAHPGQVLGYIAPLAPDTNPRLAPLDPQPSPAQFLTAPVMPSALPDCTQMRCGVAIALEQHLETLYDQWMQWLSPLAGVAGVLLTAGFLSLTLDPFFDLAALVEAKVVWQEIRSTVITLTGSEIGGMIVFLTPEIIAELQRLIFCLLTCDGDVVSPTVAQIQAWEHAVYSDVSLGLNVLQNALLVALLQFTPLQNWQVVASKATPSTACASWVCP